MRVTWTVLSREGHVTSCRDGNHSIESLHYFRANDPRRFPLNPEGSHGAFDLRTWKFHNVPGQIMPVRKQRYRDVLQEKLDGEFPGEFQVVIEATHIHVEHDPK